MESSHASNGPVASIQNPSDSQNLQEPSAEPGDQDADDEATEDTDDTRSVLVQHRHPGPSGGVPGDLVACQPTGTQVPKYLGTRVPRYPEVTCNPRLRCSSLTSSASSTASSQSGGLATNRKKSIPLSIRNLKRKHKKKRTKFSREFKPGDRWVTLA